MQALINSRLVNTGSGAIFISDSNMQVLGGVFSSNFGTVAGALLVQGQSSVLIDSTSMANNTATAGGALVVRGPLHHCIVCALCHRHNACCQRSPSARMDKFSKASL